MASPKLYTWSHVADDLLTQRAKNGDIGECYAVGDAYYHYYLDNNSTDTNLLYTAEHWFNRGNRLGGTAGYYALGLVYMQYAKLYSGYTDKHIQTLCEAEHYFLCALYKDEDMEACYELGVLYFDHADVIDLAIDVVDAEEVPLLSHQKRKKMELAEQYLLNASQLQSEYAEMADYQLGILYWDLSTDSKSKQKSEYLKKSQYYFDKPTTIQDQDTLRIISRLFFSSGNILIGLKYAYRSFIDE